MLKPKKKETPEFDTLLNFRLQMEKGDSTPKEAPPGGGNVMCV